MKSRKGFTLIELLVVVAIIALLIAILIPALTRAKQQSEISSCLSNLSQLTKANALYTTEWNGSFVPAYGPFPSTGVQSGSISTAFDFLVAEAISGANASQTKIANIWKVCPTIARNDPQGVTSGVALRSYAYNGFIGGYLSPTNASNTTGGLVARFDAPIAGTSNYACKPYNISSVKNQSELAVFTEDIYAQMYDQNGIPQHVVFTVAGGFNLNGIASQTPNIKVLAHSVDMSKKTFKDYGYTYNVESGTDNVAYADGSARSVRIRLDAKADGSCTFFAWTSTYCNPATKKQ